MKLETIKLIDKMLREAVTKAKEWYDEVWKAQRDFANNDWR